MLLQISSLLNYLSLHRSLEIKLSSMAFLLINLLIFRFQKMLSSGAKYDVIVDGLNVALYRWPKVRSKDFNQQSFSVSRFTRVTRPLTTEGIQKSELGKPNAILLPNFLKVGNRTVCFRTFGTMVHLVHLEL